MDHRKRNANQHKMQLSTLLRIVILGKRTTVMPRVYVGQRLLAGGTEVSGQEIPKGPRYIYAKGNPGIRMRDMNMN